MERNMLNISLRDRQKSTDIRQKTKVKDIVIAPAREGEDDKRVDGGMSLHLVEEQPRCK